MIQSLPFLQSSIFEDIFLCMIYKHNLNCNNLHKWIRSVMRGEENVHWLWEKLQNRLLLSVMLWYCCKSHFILLHLWMDFFNEAEYAAASNVCECGIITFYNHDEYVSTHTHTHTHTPVRHPHVYSHVQSQKAYTQMWARLSFTHHFLSSLPHFLSHTPAEVNSADYWFTQPTTQQHRWPAPGSLPFSSYSTRERRKGEAEGKKETETVVLTCENIMEVGLKVKTEDYKVNPGSATQLERFYFCMHALDAGPYCGLSSHPGKAQSNVGNVASKMW